eukprot:scaffold982_cov139-Cylindrotheca_fusiformis.AAC.16
MTCSRCSDAVKTTLSSLKGVQNVSVSLSTNLARVQYIESADCSVETIREEVEDIGYDVNDIIIPKEEKLTKKIEVAVGGMTCSMCSSAVHSALVDTPGVVSVNVSLSTNLATIEFEPSPDCNIESLTDIIECIGYDVSDVIEKKDEGKGGFDDEGEFVDMGEGGGGEDRLQRIIVQQNGQLHARKRAFLLSCLGALPTLGITMFIPKVFPKECYLIQFLHQDVSIFNHSFVLESLFLWMFTTPVQFICGYTFYKTSFHGIRRGILGMDVLVALGTTASYFYAFVAMWARDPSYRFFETSAVLICFVLLGKWMNAMAVCRTSEALTQLMKLQAKTALRVIPNTNDVEKWNPLADTYEEKSVSIQSIRPGHIVKILKGASIPADGILIHGEMSVDESMITGESIPSLKTPGDQVLGGTICSETGTGILKSSNATAAAFVRVTGVGSATALAQIVQLVQDAQTRQVPIQNLADTIAGIFVPTVVAISLFTFLVWYGCCKMGFVPAAWYEGESPATFAMLFGIASLVISCPCALGLATPSAIMVGTGVGARCGVLMKGGETLEIASKVDTIIFDKTGTLTKGKPVVTDIIRLIDEDALLKIASSDISQTDGENYLIWLFGSLERNSEHPLAAALVSYAEERLANLLEEKPFAQPTNFLALTGRGAAGTINGVKVSIGNRAFAEHEQMQISDDVERTLRDLESEGKTGMLAGLNGRVCAIVGIADELKDEAEATIACLRDMGLDIWMVTGDSKRTAAAIAEMLDLPSNRVISEALPSVKVDTIRKLQSDGCVVAMVGDGVNDSPALAAADVGMSMGTGAEIATEASDMILVSGKVSDTCVALDLSKVIFRRIQWNIVFSIVYNLLGIPLAAGVLFPFFQTRLPPTVAAIAMSLSSISVVFSSLALRFYKPIDILAPTKPRRLPQFLRMNQRHEYTPVEVEDSIELKALIDEIV